MTCGGDAALDARMLVFLRQAKLVRCRRWHVDDEN